MNPEISDRNPLFSKSITLLELSTIKRGEEIFVIDVRFGANRVVFHTEPTNDDDGYVRMLIVYQDRKAGGFAYTPSVTCLSAMGIIPYTERWDGAHFCIKDTAEERQALLDYLNANPGLGWNGNQIRYDLAYMDRS